jgi:hypothetical protein
MVDDSLSIENPILFKSIEQLQKSATIPDDIKTKLGEIKTAIEPFEPEQLKKLTEELETQLTRALINGYRFEKKEHGELNELVDAFLIKAERPEKIKQLKDVTECLSESLGTLRSNAPMPDCLRQKSRGY